jgi:protein-tyrosine phosphatase
MIDVAPDGIEKDCWPLEDGAGNHRSDIDGALRKLDRLLAKHERVLVHCNAGKSRSCGLVALWIARRERLRLADALARVAAKRSVMWVTPDFQDTLEGCLD